jgi:hypothetical protein
MNMKPKVLLAIAAAVGAAAVVVLATGAFAGTPGRSDHSGDSLVSCLASHGVQVPTDNPAVVKQWLADHQGDPALQAALQACQPSEGTADSYSPAALGSCLEQHGVDVPDNVKETPDALKAWLVEAVKQPGVSAALDACTGGPPPSGQTK